MNNPLKLLIIEDDSDFLLLLRKIFKSFDEVVEISEANNAESAFSMLSEDFFDCVLLDQNLPGLNGIEFLQRLLAGGDLQVPIIMMTADGSETIAAQAIKSGASDYIPKENINKHDLHRSITNAIRFFELEQRAQRAEYELARTGKHFRTIVEKVTDIIFQLDPEGNISYVNPACKFLGYEKDELLGKPIKSVVGNKDLEDILPKLMTREVGPLITSALEIDLITNDSYALSNEFPVIKVLVDAIGLWNAPDEVVFKSNKGLEFLGTLCICRRI